MLIFIVKSICYLFVVTISLVFTFKLFSLSKNKLKSLNLSDMIISNIILLLGSYQAVTNLIALNAQNYKFSQILAYILIFSITASLLAVLISFLLNFITQKIKLANSTVNELSTVLILIGLSLLVYFWYVIFLDIILPYPDLIYK